MNNQGQHQYIKNKEIDKDPRESSKIHQFYFDEQSSQSYIKAALQSDELNIKPEQVEK